MCTTKSFAFAILMLAVAGCDKGAEKAAAEPDTHGDHAPADAKPGSHEDWCVEHAVAESMCTRCNASLTPAFKASGDWCEEHTMPKSQCLACNPDLKIERPPKTAAK